MSALSGTAKRRGAARVFPPPKMKEKLMAGGRPKDHAACVWVR